MKKVSRSYQQDARFHQFAKRVVSQKALGDSSASSSTSEAATSKSLKTRSYEWLVWFFAKTKGKMIFTACVILLLCLLMSRPLFYVVLARGLALALRIFLRRSVGLIVTLLDALLDEAAASLEASFIAPPVQGSFSQPHVNGFELQQQHWLTAC